jgi:hypothetical protein
MTANVEHELWKQFEQATSARDRAELSEAIRLLREILAMAPPGERKLITATNQQLGYIAGSLETPNNPVAAVGYFAKAAELSPRSELSSLGLFHALDAAGRLDDALAEGVRYLSLRMSEDYRAMFSAGFGSGLSIRGQELLSEGRAHLARWGRDREGE